MKFVKKNSWEKEWQETLREEESYLRARARKKESPLNEKLEEHIPDTLQSTLDAAFNKAFALIFEKGTGVIEKTYNREKAAAAALYRHTAARETGSRESLRAFRRGASLTAGKNLALSGVEGVGLGLLGIGIPDIPLFAAMILRSLYAIAADYGYGHDGLNEKLFQLKLIDAALSHGPGLREKNQAIDRYIGLGRWEAGERLNDQIAATAAQLSGELLYMKFLQGIPLAGAVGGAYDVVYLRAIQRYGRIKYHKRFLLDQKNSPDFYQ